MYKNTLLHTNVFCIVIQAAIPSHRMSDRVLGRCMGITHQARSTGLQ